MKKPIFILSVLLAVTSITYAQTTNKAITEHDAAVKAKDDAIKNDIITPAEQSGAPDWAALTQTIAQKYDATTADRTITKAKIYFYYSKDKAQFCTSIVHYTNSYELADDFKLLNLNAGMISQSSQEQSELKAALKWAKAAADSDPNNEKYKQTVEALQGKINP